MKMNTILQIAAVLLLAATPAHDYTGFQTVQVAPGIYTYVGPECTPAGLVTGNVTAIIGEEAVLVVDSGHFPSSARKMIAHLKGVTSKPVKFLVNTHWHQDHVMGNIAFLREWPKVEILAHPFTVKELEKPENGKAYAENLQQQLPGAMEQLRGILASGKLPNGNALSETQRENFQEMVAAFTVSIRKAPEMEFVPATRMIERDTEISLGKRTVQIRFLGEGNTAGDLIVYVPDAKVLLTGDMVVYPTPFALDARLGVWAKTMDKLLAIEAVKIVPGHGPPMEDKTYLNDVRRLLLSMEEQTRAQVAAGTPKNQAAEKIDVAWFREKYVTSKIREGSFLRWFLRPVVDNAYKAAEHK
jgi:glyoxylase-like metal-dependent hydrolase (beta-lactamase superfamily II)